MSCPHEPKKGDKCPVDHSKNGFVSVVGGFSELDPRNNIPRNLDSPGSEQVDLSNQREKSTIPNGNGTWEYPSPLQFFNALKRKGWETPQSEIDMMVDIHNFLNEGTWQQLLSWEQKYHCDCKDIKLVKFQGKPSTMTPKARFLSTLGLSPKPFDRHDWIIDRCGTKARYVIDFYSGTDETTPTGEKAPVFHVDVRPALDSPQAVYDRARSLFDSLMDRLRA